MANWSQAITLCGYNRLEKVKIFGMFHLRSNRNM